MQDDALNNHKWPGTRCHVLHARCFQAYLPWVPVTMSTPSASSCRACFGALPPTSSAAHTDGFARCLQQSVCPPHLSATKLHQAAPLFSQHLVRAELSWPTGGPVCTGQGPRNKAPYQGPCQALKALAHFLNGWGLRVNAWPCPRRCRASGAPGPWRAPG